MSEFKYVRSPQSEVWCTKSDEIWGLMSDVCPKTSCLNYVQSLKYYVGYVCSKPGVQKPKSKVQSMSKVQNPGLKLKSEVCQLSKSETEVQSLTPINSKFEVESLKSEVESLS